MSSRRTLSRVPRWLKRAVKLVLEALPIVPACRRLAGRRLASAPIVLCIDVEPDDRVLERGGARPWFGFARMAELVGPLRRELAAVSGQRVRLSWFVRMDPQVDDTWGSPAWAAAAHRTFFAAVDAEGDDIGLHAHHWRRDAALDDWVTDHDPAWAEHCVTVGLDAFEATFGRPARAYRGGDQALTGPLLGLLAARGVKVDLTVERGLPPGGTALEGERVMGARADYDGVPSGPYRSSPARFPSPDPTGGDPLLVPLLSGPRERGRWARTLVLGTHPTFFAVRLLGILLRRSPPVLAFALRTDPDLLRAWDPVVANLRHLARHPGARFAAVSELAGALADGTRQPGPLGAAA